MVARSDRNKLGQYEERQTLQSQYKHKMVRVQVGTLEDDIDEEIASLIEEIWKAGIRTVMSCQENRPGWAWIQFPSAETVDSFLDIVAPPEEETGTLSERGRHRWERGLVDLKSKGDEPGEGYWQYDSYDRGSQILMSVRFPTSDIAVIEERLTSHNESLPEGSIQQPSVNSDEEEQAKSFGVNEALQVVKLLLLELPKDERAHEASRIARSAAIWGGGHPEAIFKVLQDAADMFVDMMTQTSQMGNKHKMVRVQVGSFEDDIDEEIAPLIEEIWKADIRTINSCQENRPGIVWIEFPTVYGAADFLNIAAGPFSHELDGLYNRISLAWERDPGPVEGAWKYDLHPFDMAVGVCDVDDGSVEEKPTGPPEFVFGVSIRFPRSDLPILLKRLRAFNEGRCVGSEAVLAPAP